MTEAERRRFDAAIEEVYEVAIEQIDANHAELAKYRDWYREERERARGAFRWYVTAACIHMSLGLYLIFQIATSPVCK